ncbi:PQQ-dependent sugar dehydrogenase [Bacillus sp. ISL-18]|uniref:PQQ-dependent sugar dehydrogenase n=1 Tax=Bacillus sp. ISL-18 TaxID=2819118 RepID=UPI001BE72A99|nr:PQQ-dependent sugar dehydrogenase [Bacillus sp. ISL-18]
MEKIRLNGNGWEEIEVLLDELPGGSYHDGGRLEIGPDNKLYATVGDAYNLDEVQDLGSLSGKI